MAVDAAKSPTARGHAVSSAGTPLHAPANSGYFETCAGLRTPRNGACTFFGACDAAFALFCALDIGAADETAAGKGTAATPRGPSTKAVPSPGATPIDAVCWQVSPATSAAVHPTV